MLSRFVALIILILVGGCSLDKPAGEKREWLAGDHHIHSRFSVGWDDSQSPPAPTIGGDAIYPIPMNALMGRYFGLSWMVATDHGGPNHSRVNHDLAYPELVMSRQTVPEVIQFFGMELNAPGADHSSLIVPHDDHEAKTLRYLESTYDKREAYPLDPARDNEDLMLEALADMQGLARPPVVIANHPSRSARGYGEYGLDDPAEFRRWNDTAPSVAVGMAGAPGHQAVQLSTNPRFTDDVMRLRGFYRGYPTMGGFDQMTAKLGGFWDSMLGEGRRWWITANSDSHVHYSEGGVDFWPGEYSKTYVYAARNHQDILGGIRSGRIFVTTGDLVSELFVTVSLDSSTAGIGGELTVPPGSEVSVTVRFLDPAGKNHREESPAVERVDLITGEVTGNHSDPDTNHNPTTRVMERVTSEGWARDGEYSVITTKMTVNSDMYFRVRGTNTDELEPEVDPPNEYPWQDLWFYSNPVFISVAGPG